MSGLDDNRAKRQAQFAALAGKWQVRAARYGDRFSHSPDLEEIAAPTSQVTNFVDEASRVLPFGTHKQMQELSSDERIEEARKHIGCGTDSNDVANDIKTVLSLFDPSQDADNADWLNAVGIALNEPKSSYFQDELAFRFLLRSAELGSPAAAFNVGQGWLHGDYGRIDGERALKWLRTAVDRNHGCAATSLVEVLQGDPRYGDPAHPEFNNELNEILEKGAANGPFAFIEVAARMASGYGFEKNTEGAISRYRAMLGPAMEGMCNSSYPRAYAAMRLALRYFLGFDVEQNLGKMNASLQHIPEESHSPNIRYKLNNISRRLKFISERLETKSIAHSNKNASNEWTEFHYAGDLVRSLHAGSRSFEEVTSSIELGTITSTAPLSDHLWAVVQLANSEGWPNASSWTTMWQIAQARILGVSQTELRSSRADIGPNFNKTIDDVVPILGSFVDARDQLSAPMWRRIVAVTLDSGNDLRIGEGGSDADPFLVSQEDIDVACVLAFADSKGPIWPSLSLEPYDKMTPERLRWSLKRKEWLPVWLGHTAWGKTMYATDLLLGEYGSDCERHGATPENAKLASTVINRIRLAGGRADGLWSRVMLYPKSVNLDVNPHSKNAATCHIHSVRMAVLGANCTVEDNGDEDRSLNRNSNAYSVGRLANLLTEHYDDTAHLVPMFERMRQLNGLLYALVELRKHGYMPNGALKKKIDHLFDHFRILPDLPLRKRLVA